MRINNIIFLLCFIFLVSCQSETKYHSYISTSTDGWKKSDILKFNITDSLSQGVYRMELGIRHSELYKYKNLWVEIKANPTDAKTFKCDSIQILLADEKGNWKGNGISSLYQRDTILAKEFIITNRKKMRIDVRQIMRDKNLPGIRDVGIRLIKVSN